MRFLPESQEVMDECINDLVRANRLSMATEDPSIGISELGGKFVQGALYVMHCTAELIGRTVMLLQTMNANLVEYSYTDVIEFASDEAGEIADSLFKYFINMDRNSFHSLVMSSYCQGLVAVASWFLPIVATYGYLEETIEQHSIGEDEDGET